MGHDEPSGLTEQIVVANLGGGAIKIQVVDWWDRVSGLSWMSEELFGNLAVVEYAVRAGMIGLPIDDEVLYGLVGGLGHLFHVTEIREEE